MSTPGIGSIFGSSIIWGHVDYGPTFGRVYRPVTNVRTVTAAGNDTILPFDQNVRYNKTVPAQFAILLPDLRLWMNRPYGGFPLHLKDAALNSSAFPITVTAFAGQFIDGSANWTIRGNGAALDLQPMPDMTGWEVW